MFIFYGEEILITVVVVIE